MYNKSKDIGNNLNYTLDILSLKLLLRDHIVLNLIFFFIFLFKFKTRKICKRLLIKFCYFTDININYTFNYNIARFIII